MCGGGDGASGPRRVSVINYRPDKRQDVRSFSMDNAARQCGQYEAQAGVLMWKINAQEAGLRERRRRRHDKTPCDFRKHLLVNNINTFDDNTFIHFNADWNYLI